MMMRGGLLGDYHIMRPGEDFPSQDIVRGPAAPGDAGLWQEPEDGRHPGEVMKSPVRKVADTSRSDATQRGLFDSDEDLAAWLARMTSPPPPVRGGYEHSFAPGMQARINAEVQPQRDSPPTISPSIAATLGPLSLNGGFSAAPTPEGGTRLQPNFGAGLKVPLPGEATGEAKFSLTPGELLQLDAEYRRKLLGGDLSVRGSYSQPTNGPPGGSAMLRWGRSF